jgi:hypothetical protein
MQEVCASIGSYDLRSCYTNADAIPISPVAMMSVVVIAKNRPHSRNLDLSQVALD